MSVSKYFHAAFRQLTICIACDVLHRELEYGRITRDRSLNGDNPWPEAISPSLCTCPEKLMKSSGVVDLNFTTLLAIGQRW